METLEKGRRSGVFLVNFELISHFEQANVGWATAFNSPEANSAL